MRTASSRSVIPAAPRSASPGTGTISNASSTDFCENAREQGAVHDDPGLPEEPGGLRGDARDPGSRAATGWCESPADAEVIVVNTCAFIGPAKQESVDTILELAELQEDRPVQHAGGHRLPLAALRPELAKEMPEVDHFLGTGAYAQIGDLLAAEAAPRQVIPDPDYIHDARTPKVNSSPKYTAYLKISEGCDNACAFCIIPTLRGAQRSRPIDDIVAEARSLAASGVRELNLVAQDLTAYGHDLPGQPQAARAAPGAVQGGRAVDPPALRLPARVPRRADRRHRPRAEDRQVPGHAAAARLGPAAALDEARPRLRVPRRAAGEAPRPRARAHLPHLADRRAARARPRRTSSCSRSSSEDAALRADGLLPVLGRGGHRGLRHARTRCRRRSSSGAGARSWRSRSGSTASRTAS